MRKSKRKLVYESWCKSIFNFITGLHAQAGRGGKCCNFIKGHLRACIMDIPTPQRATLCSSGLPFPSPSWRADKCRSWGNFGQAVTSWPHSHRVSQRWKRVGKRPEREWFMILITSQATIQMFKLDLENAEEPEIKLPTSTGSLKEQESSRKISISALLTMPKPLTVWIKINCGKFRKRWEYQTTWPASWEIFMQVRKQQLELDMEQ